MTELELQHKVAKTVPRTRDIEGTRCIVCDGVYAASRLPGLLECAQCSFVSADVSISDEQLNALYREEYFHGQEYLDYVAEEDSLRLNFRNRIATLRTLIPNLSACDLFEIGCAYGFFLDEVKSVVHSAAGIDISGDAVQYAIEKHRVDARQGDYLSLDLGRKVDVIAMWDTVEHLRRPDLFIEKAAHDLKPGGVITITTGDIGSLNARLRGRHWRMIHPPTHLHYFSVATLSKLLQRHALDPIHVSHPGNSRRLRSVLYFIFALKLKRKGVYDALESWPILRRAMTVNLFDIMYVVACKRDAPAKAGTKFSSPCD
jgi:2-polyprenyl-3-methyl-5-hydroxy-6-metoxy-1,4-benzoquinol methylase